jgi:hypothetical protein
MTKSGSKKYFYVDTKKITELTRLLMLINKYSSIIHSLILLPKSTKLGL